MLSWSSFLENISLFLTLLIHIYVPNKLSLARPRAMPIKRLSRQKINHFSWSPRLLFHKELRWARLWGHGSQMRLWANLARGWEFVLNPASLPWPASVGSWLFLFSRGKSINHHKAQHFRIKAKEEPFWDVNQVPQRQVKEEIWKKRKKRRNTWRGAGQGLRQTMECPWEILWLIHQAWLMWV